MSYNLTETKAKLLMRVLEKHDPKYQLEDLAFKVMQNHKPGTDEFKVSAALYELMSVFKQS